MDESVSFLQENYRAIEKEFFGRLSSYLEKNDSPMHYAYRKIIQNIRKKAISDKWTDINYEIRLDEAQDIFQDIADAMKAYWKDAPKHEVVSSEQDSAIYERPSEWSQPSPIDSSLLDSATSKYLNEAWLQTNSIDRWIINAFLFDELIILTDQIRSGKALLGRPILAYTLSDGKYIKTMGYQYLFALLAFLGRWVVFPVVLFALYYFEKFEYIPWIGIPYGLYILYYLFFLPKKIIHKRGLKKKFKEFEKRLQSLANIYDLARKDTVNPSRLKDQLVEVESSGVRVVPAVYALLDRAIQRDPAVFTY